MNIIVIRKDIFYICQVTDKGGLTSNTATVTVDVVDCNDNAPIFDGTQSQHRHTFAATECAGGGRSMK